MITAPIPEDESLRLNDLLSHQILDTEEEESYTEILAIAAAICDCPTALISLVDKDRQWFKEKINLQESELPRDTSFCGHAIQQNDLFIVEDARNDIRFHDNPNVTGDLNIGFYAGAQIVSKSGFALGTVCVIDDKPKSISDSQKDTLRKIASQVSRMMDVKKQKAFVRDIAGGIYEKELKNQKNFETFFMQSTSPKIIFSAGGVNIIDANEEALKLYGYSKNEFLRMSAIDIRANKSKKNMMSRVARVEGSSNPVTLRGKHITREGKQLSVSLKLSTIFYKGSPATLADIKDTTESRNLLFKLKDEKESVDKKMVMAAGKAKDKERRRNTDILRENINQILACTNLYLDLAKKNEHVRLELIEKSQSNVMLAIKEIKKLYKLPDENIENNFLENAMEDLVLKYELLKAFNITFTFEGEEKFAPIKARELVYNLVTEYFDAAAKVACIKNVWLTISFGAAVNVIIKNDNSMPDSRKRKEYLQLWRNKIIEFNGTVELIENGNISCTLQVSIPMAVPSSVQYRKFTMDKQPN